MTTHLYAWKLTHSPKNRLMFRRSNLRTQIYLINLKSLHFGNLNFHAKLEKLWLAGDKNDI